MIARLLSIVAAVALLALFGWRGYIFAVPVILLGYTLAGLVEGVYLGLRGGLSYRRSVRS